MSNMTYIQFLDNLSAIKPQFDLQKKQAIYYTEQLIQNDDFSYIPRILSCLPIGVIESTSYLEISSMDADMRRLKIICEILLAEQKVPNLEPGFLGCVNSYGDLIQKYIYVTLLLRRTEHNFPKKTLEETIGILINKQISIYAIRKITRNEIFFNPELVYNRALKIIGIYRGEKNAE